MDGSFSINLSMMIAIFGAPLMVSSPKRQLYPNSIFWWVQIKIRLKVLWSIPFYSIYLHIFYISSLHQKKIFNCIQYTWVLKKNKKWPFHLWWFTISQLSLTNVRFFFSNTYCPECKKRPKTFFVLVLCKTVVHQATG